MLQVLACATDDGTAVLAHIARLYTSGRHPSLAHNVAHVRVRPNADVVRRQNTMKSQVRTCEAIDHVTIQTPVRRAL